MTEWIGFSIAYCFTVVILYIPGYFVLRKSYLGSMEALATAPVISLFCILFLTQVIHLQMDISLLFVTSVAVSLIIGKLVELANKTYFKYGDKKTSNFGIEVVTVYVAVGLFVTVLFFIKNLDGPGSFIQDWDNVYHLSVVKSFYETSNFDMLHVSAYRDIMSTGAPFGENASFYPALWHMLCAIIASATGVAITTAVNAVNAVLLSIVFPLSCYVAFAQIEPTDKVFQICGAIVCLAFIGFPWRFLLWGPIYPNLMAYSLLPVIISVCIRAVSFVYLKYYKRIVFECILLLFTAVTLALSHPNSIFTAAVVLVPFFVSNIYSYSMRSSKKDKKANGYFFSLLFLLVVVAIWTLLFNSERFNNVTAYNWNAWTGFFQAVVNFVTLSFAPSSAVHLPLMLIVALGIYTVLSKRKNQWMLFSVLMSLWMYVLSVSTDGFLKHFFTGFWYTDYTRIAGVSCLTLMPLAVYGLRALILRLQEIAKSRGINKGSSIYITSAMTLILLFAPSFTLYGLFDWSTPFGKINNELEWCNSETSMTILNLNEYNFAKKVIELIPEDALVINSPNEGSTFLYPLLDMNVFYRTVSHYGDPEETPESLLIRTRLDEYGMSEEVTEAVNSIGADYVLILDRGGLPQTEATLFMPYDFNDWSGLYNLDNNPHFEIVAAEDDMTLYRII